MKKEYFEKIRPKLVVGAIVYIDKNDDETTDVHNYVSSKRNGTKCYIECIGDDELATIKRVSDDMWIEEFWLDDDYYMSNHFCNCFRIFDKPRYSNE